MGKKGNPCHKAGKTSLNCLCSTVLWKVDLETNEIGYLTEEISKQSFEEAANPIYEASTLMM